MLDQAYNECLAALRETIPAERLITDPLRTLTYGTDASFYRLVPKIVVKAESEQDVVAVLSEARGRKLPVTFRAAGTSLSGQAISDSILVLLGDSWIGHHIADDASRVALQPGVIGAHANAFLAPFGKKIGPDPASINAAMIGGIAANNASGMCCGTAQNSYKTLASMKVILADGAMLDTADPDSRRAFEESHAPLVEGLRSLAGRVKANAALANRIRSKYKMKNTTGYSLNALVDFDDPVDILQHLMVGSEGTLGFISEVTYHTVDELAHKATSLMLFPDVETACKAVTALKRCPVDAVELMDRPALRSVEGKDGMPDYLASLDEAVAALLVETRATDAETLAKQKGLILDGVANLPTARSLEFTSDPAECKKLWDIRKGLFPSVGAMRRAGTTVIIEDVAFPVDRLAEATLDLQSLLSKHGYVNAIIFGHSLEGNLHFVFTQDFNDPAEVARYAAFIEEVTTMVVSKYNGSLKAEHGTGRNMAPFVVKEWGEEAFGLMKEIKELFDPEYLLNPGVILNADAEIHLKDLKPLPAADPIVDKCIECGFCEPHCPSRALTLTPRHRIVAYRELAARRARGEAPSRRDEFKALFNYQCLETCATDGLCATACPVEINTGMLVKLIRNEEATGIANRTASFLASHFRALTGGMRFMLSAVNLVHAIIGTRALGWLARTARWASFGLIPLWNPWMPKGADKIRTRREPAGATTDRVVYYPSCINRTMGTSRGDGETESLTTVTIRLLEKAGFEVLFPENMSRLCCGMAFDSKGYKAQGMAKAKELEAALLKVSEGGKIPVYVDMSPCLLRMKDTLTPELKLYEPVEFILEYLADRLEFTPTADKVAIHSTCSTIKMGLSERLADLAGKCASNVIVPEGIECCGWAGDRGFTYPELNASALRTLHDEIPEDCEAGYSTSRTCEIGLSLHSGIPYKSIVYLVERSTRAKASTEET